MHTFRWLIPPILLLLVLAGCGSTPQPQPTVAALQETPAVASPTPVATGESAARVPEATPSPAPTSLPPTSPVAEPTPVWLPSVGLRTPEEAALESAGGQRLGGTVSVLAVWSGGEQETFLSIVEPFEKATGITVEYEGTRDLSAVLTTRIQGDSPPDLAGLPGPGYMRQFAEEGALVNLAGALDIGRFSTQYAGAWAELGTVDGDLVGIFIKATAKGLIWYNPTVWQAAGLAQPATWEEMAALSQRIAQAGTAPWCIALESEAASGWPGTDWLEDIVLRQAGIDVYNQWWRGELPWTSPAIRHAWETWGQIAADPQMVFGGPQRMLATNFGNVGDPLFTDPPGCYMAHQASFISDFMMENTPGLEPLEDFDFFGFPPFGDDSPVSSVIAGDLFGMFNDTPQARALIGYLTTPEAQALWVQRGGAISPNQAVPLELYPDDLSRKAAERLAGATLVAFDASDQMPEAINSAFWHAVLRYVQNPADLTALLEELEVARVEHYERRE